ncbi:hypothetical protein JNO04_04735 [Halomonas sp. MC140]|nr:hypothetical protein [Halomonas sp. MC140]MDN7131660.1 hypothetical protein [Halomonas sp. MC140]
MAMEFLGYVTLFFLLSLVAVTPIYFSLFKYGFVKSILASVIVCSVLVVCIYWGSDVFADLRLSMMGYGINGLSDFERLEGVPLEMHKEATQLYQSTFGVGWPLSAILALSIFVAPYILIIVSFATFYKMWRSKNIPNKARQKRPAGWTR